VPEVLDKDAYSVQELVANTPFISATQKEIIENSEHPGVEYM
jgi:hypothetical protein